MKRYLVRHHWGDQPPQASDIAGGQYAERAIGERFWKIYTTVMKEMVPFVTTGKVQLQIGNE